jgi:hypothetical protein
VQPLLTQTPVAFGYVQVMPQPPQFSASFVMFVSQTVVSSRSQSRNAPVQFE